MASRCLAGYLVLVLMSILTTTFGVNTDVTIEGCEPNARGKPVFLCVGFPLHCEKTHELCQFLFKAVYDAGKRQLIADIYTRHIKPGMYSAVAFSKDKFMGSDIVHECVVLNDGKVTMRHGSTTNRTANLSTLRYIPDPLGIRGVGTKAAAIEDGVLRCQWIRDHAVFHNDEDWTLAGNGYHVLFAQGLLDANNYPLYHGQEGRQRFGGRLGFPELVATDEH